MKILYTLLITFLMSFTSLYCQKNEFKCISLYNFYIQSLKLNKINSNPIVFDNRNIINCTSDIDLDKLIYRCIDVNNICLIPKGFSYLNKFFGPNAENGLIYIKNYIIFFDCPFFVIIL